MPGGSSINIATGAAWTENYRDEYPDRVKAHLYSKSLIENILDQNGCVGIRFYNAINDNDELCLVLVGVDSSGDDMTAGTLVERGQACPTACDTGSVLYTGA